MEEGRAGVWSRTAFVVQGLGAEYQPAQYIFKSLDLSSTDLGA